VSARIADPLPSRQSAIDSGADRNGAVRCRSWNGGAPILDRRSNFAWGGESGNTASRRGLANPKFVPAGSAAGRRWEGRDAK
jgi:hypothetical protein